MRALSSGFGFALSLAIGSTLISCTLVHRERPAPATVWAIAAAALVTIDSTSLRPVLASAASDNPAEPRGEARLPRIATVSTYQGSRYHPETIRSLADDPQVMATAAGAISKAVATVGDGVFLDFQNASPDDLQRLVDISRSIADSARARGISPIGIVVPPGDTVSYPTAVLSRAADFIVVRLYGEHRPGTPAGPTSSPEWILRQLAMRSVDVGANRLVAELALFGYLWDSDGGARSVTFAEAQALVAAESGSFRRDETSGLLTASGRRGWTVWIPDAQSIVSMVRTARTTGVNRFALAGVEGADPEVWVRLGAAIRR